MDFMNIDKLILFILFFVPGFISMKVYDLVIPGDKKDSSKLLSEAIAFSSINFAALFWLIIIIHSNDFDIKHPYWYLLLIILIIFVFPIIWPLVYLNILSWPYIKKIIIDPIPKSWDYVFMKREGFWIIVHLKDGRRIGGKFFSESFASLHPFEEQIYIEEVWKLNEKGVFLEAVDRTRGVLVMRDEISSIEFFELEEYNVSE